jgi:hypothetical protein
VPAWNAFSYVFGPLAAFGAIGVLILVLKWAFGRRSSVVAAAPKIGRQEEYGLLVPVASPTNYIDGELLRRRLEDAGIRANLAQTADGPRVLVWPQDVDKARAVCAGSP